MEETDGNGETERCLRNKDGSFSLEMALIAIFKIGYERESVYAGDGGGGDGYGGAGDAPAEESVKLGTRVENFRL